MSLCIIVGPTCVGKTAVSKKLSKLPNMCLSKTHTSREQREEEKQEGYQQQYYFHSEEEFKQLIRQKKFFEYIEFSGNYYGSMKEDIENAISNKDIFYISVMDIDGAIFYKKHYPDVVTIFLLPENIETLKERIENRNSESKEHIRERLEIAVNKEIPNSYKMDYQFVNADLEKTVDLIYNMLMSKLNAK